MLTIIATDDVEADRRMIKGPDAEYVPTPSEEVDTSDQATHDNGFEEFFPSDPSDETLSHQNSWDNESGIKCHPANYCRICVRWRQAWVRTSRRLHLPPPCTPFSFQ